MVKTRIQSPNPKVMTPCGLVGELIYSQPSQDRKKILLDIIYNQSVSQDNFDYWLEALKICHKEQFFPVQVITKIHEVIKYIEALSKPNPILKKICQSTDLPKKIIEAACFKSKTRLTVKL